MRKRNITNRILAVLLSISIIISAIPLTAYAEEIQEEDGIDTTICENILPETLPAGAESSAANIRTVNDVISQIKFAYKGNGHSFAAEQGNDFIDKIKGKNTIVIGDDNAKNGADRLIINRDGTVISIQDKYYNNATASIDACFDTSGKFRYIDGDGNLMQIEVPKDQYEAAVSRMEQKIIEGKVPGVEDPAEAKNLVRKGNLTYKQAENLAKAGTLESLTYDAAHGVISAGGAFGISTVLNYAVCRINGQDREKALKVSAIEGVRTGVGVFATSVIASQLTKTGIMNVFKPSSEALTRALGEDFSKVLLKAYGQRVLADTGESVAQSATKQAAQLLRAEVLVAVVTTIVFSVPDGIDVFRGRISKKQFIKNFAVTAVSVFAGTAGYGVGGALANLVVPGVGTVPGAIVGSILFGLGGGLLADKIADYITDDDAEEMYAILENQFAQLCEDYMVNENEAQNIVNQFSENLNSDMFKDMYQSEDREKFATDSLEPLFEAEVAKRAKIEAPTEEEMRIALKEELEGVVFVH
ncbi:MAG: hypothetical protein J1F41_03480 [Lachnospiraceae bacterium]|nr:hypothetical protein [Lachnospiraceae bacterium]